MYNKLLLQYTYIYILTEEINADRILGQKYMKLHIETK